MNWRLNSVQANWWKCEANCTKIQAKTAYSITKARARNAHVPQYGITSKSMMKYRMQAKLRMHYGWGGGNKCHSNFCSFLFVCLVAGRATTQPFAIIVHARVKRLHLLGERFNRLSCWWRWVAVSATDGFCELPFHSSTQSATGFSVVTSWRSNPAVKFGIGFEIHSVSPEESPASNKRT